MTPERWFKRIKKLIGNHGVVDRMKLKHMPERFQKSPRQYGLPGLTFTGWQSGELLHLIDERITDDVMNAVGEWMIEEKMAGVTNKSVTGTRRYLMFDATSYRNLFAIFIALHHEGRLLGQGWETLWFKKGRRYVSKHNARAWPVMEMVWEGMKTWPK